MSVAFRRESDEEHVEPRFELPLPPGPNLVTPRGLALTRARVAELEAELGRAGEGEREALARTLRYWRTRAATAELAPPPPAGEVGFGSRVRVQMRGAERVFHIVGDDEADPALGRVSFSSPIARALAGAAEGDLIALGGGIEVLELLEAEGDANGGPDADPRPQ